MSNSDFNINLAIECLPIAFPGRYEIKRMENKNNEKFFCVVFYTPLNNKYLELYIYYDCDYNGNIIVNELNSAADEIKNLSGSKILELVINYARNNNQKIIGLEDQSSISININNEKFRIDLSALHILSSGKSWYNKFGFIQDNYSEQILLWDSIRKKSIMDLEEDFLNLNIKNIHNKGLFDSPFNLYDIDKNDDESLEIILSHLYSKEEYCNIEVEKISSMIFNNIRFYDYQDVDLLIYHVLYINCCSWLLNYNRELYLEL